MMKNLQGVDPEAYFPLKAIQADHDYYGVSLFSDDGVEQYRIVHCTYWAGFTEFNGKRVELRKAGIVPVSVYAMRWRELEEPFTVVNAIDDFAVWYFRTGGHALIEAAIMSQLMKEEMGESPAFMKGEIGFCRLSSIERGAFDRAPSKKLRMQIIERDLYRCQICGRRAVDHVDIELHVHHIRPFSRDGLTVRENLITLCHTCHLGLDPHFRPQLFQLRPSRPNLEADGTGKLNYMKKVALYQKVMAGFLTELDRGTRKRTRHAGRAKSRQQH